MAERGRRGGCERCRVVDYEPIRPRERERALVRTLTLGAVTLYRGSFWSVNVHDRMSVDQPLGFLEALRTIKDTFLGGSEVLEIVRPLRSVVRFRGSVLDLGVGDGRFLSKILSAAGGDPTNYPLIGIDLDEGSLVHARRMLPAATIVRTSLGAFVRARPEQPPLDAMLASHSLYYVENLEDSLHQMEGLLAADGVLVLSLWSDRCSIRTLACRVAQNPGNLRSAEATRELLIESSFDVELHIWEGQVDFGGWRTPRGIQAASIFLSRQVEAGGRGFEADLERYLKGLKSNIAPRRNGVLVARRRGR